MWKELTRLSEDSNSVIAQLPRGEEVGPTFSIDGLDKVLVQLEAGSFYYDDEAAGRFVRAARENKKSAFEGIVVAFRKDAEVKVELSDSDMLATMFVTGPYGGKQISAVDIMQALATFHVTKGINKLALKKILSLSTDLPKGQVIEQPVARGLQPVNGKDAQFVPLVEDASTRILAPQEANKKTHQVDMRNLGETITVEQGVAIMKRVPATKGKPGYTVMGVSIPPQPGTDKLLKEGKGSNLDRDNPNLLRASQSGMPIIRESTIDVDPSLVLKNVDVSTGHIKFKGSLVVSGNIEPGMVVRATGSVTVGGFIESADVQAQEDIIVGKGIIGHAVDEGEDKACIVKTNGNIKSKYAQFAFLQAIGDIELELHCMSCIAMCTGDLTVKDANDKHGTLSGGIAKAGGKVECLNLGVEGDTATKVQAFVRYNKYKQGLAELKERYKFVQDKTMDAIRSEMELMKRPKEERSEQEIAQIQNLKKKNNLLIEQTKGKIENAELELERLLERNTIKANKVFTRVSIQYGDETYLTKHEKGVSVFSFDQYKIHCRTMVEGVEQDEEL
ncbi:DUF342 domain-containing protein [Vibrio algarum]|uniref:FapA family protein n=1 Tax=Vibrio algarum TaxID=3020714 RepID=A0ABT4YXE9_9VIBR|nr:FapA family protein [Vibrio sp. KJ40-1]MDB1125653.1 FapA family protein [Vibrio sp. KJ40-1]